MKREYMSPTMLVVKLQHRSNVLLTTSVESLDGNRGLRLGGSDAGSDGVVRTKESSSLWDDEW